MECCWVLALDSGEAFGAGVAGRRLADMLEALQVSVLTISLLWSLVTLLYASFSDDIGLVRAWFQSSIGAFYLAIAHLLQFRNSQQKGEQAALTRKNFQNGFTIGFLMDIVLFPHRRYSSLLFLALLRFVPQNDFNLF
jgi:hypothetical protein